MSASCHDRIRDLASLIRRRWMLLAAGLLVGALACGLRASLAPPRYIARAGVAILQSRLEPAIEVSSAVPDSEGTRTALRAVPDTALQGSAPLAVTYLAARAQTFAALVQNGSVAEAVIERLGAGSRPEERSPGALLARVRGAVHKGEGGDRDLTNVIDVSVAGPTPERAALLANLWAEEFADLVNRSLGPCADRPALARALDAARRELDDAERGLSSFLAESRVEEMTREREEVLAAGDALRRARQSEVAHAGQGMAVAEAIDRAFAADGSLSKAIAAQEARAREFSGAIQDAEAPRARLASARDRARASVESIASRLDRLPAGSEMAGEEVRVVSKAPVPVTPEGPTPLSEAELGAAAGLLTGLALAWLMEVFRAPGRTGPLGAADAPVERATAEVTSAP